MKKLHYIIYGAGGIGGTIGARLIQAGCRVTLIARGEHARVMRERGLRLTDPNDSVLLPVVCVDHPREIDDVGEHIVVLMCVKSQQMETALRDLYARFGDTCRVVCVQNGVHNERAALRYFSRVYATVVNLPALHLHPGEVITHADGLGGILDTGCYPDGSDAACQEITDDLSRGGFSARPDERVMRWKYAKLLMNLGNILQAGIRTGEDITPIGRCLKHEALACFEAAGLECASRSEVDERRNGVYRMADIAGIERSGGSSWQSMARGTGDIETAYLNGEICLLGRLHGVPTPVNEACMRMARELIRRDAGPGQFTLADFADWVAPQPG